MHRYSLLIFGVIIFGNLITVSLGCGGTIQRLTPQVAQDSITSVTLCQFPNWSRVEEIVARITPQKLTSRTGRDFSSADKTYMKTYLGALKDDEAGHLVAATLGGPGQRYNLAPQDKTLNRNVNNSNNPKICEGWYNEENKIRDFLRARPQGVVDWTVKPQYGNGNSGRPNSFKLTSVYYDGGRKVDQTTGELRNQPPKCGL